MKIQFNYRKVPVISLASVAAILFSVVYPQLPAQAGPMDNMKRIMMMPEAERMQYMQTSTKGSLAKGGAMFDDAGLGTNGQACSTCHVGGGTTGGKIEMMPGMKMKIPDLHGAAATYPKFKVPNDAVITLADMNNNCIMMMQKGKPLALGSKESRDLAAYVASLK